MAPNTISWGWWRQVNTPNIYKHFEAAIRDSLMRLLGLKIAPFAAEYTGAGVLPAQRGTMKKLINLPENMVDEMLQGIYAAHSDQVTCVNGDLRCLVTCTKHPGKVALATGGGSGHLPSFSVTWARACWMAAA